MPTRNVVLTDQQSAFVDGMVKTGRFQNASEALRAGLRLLEKEEAAWDQVRRGVLEGLAQVQRGQFAEGSGEEAMRRAWARGVERAQAEWEKVRRGVIEGLAQVERGETVDGEEAFRRIREKHFASE